MKNILIIGALGNIGSELIKNFISKKFNKYNFSLIDNNFNINILTKLKGNFKFYFSNVYSLDSKIKFLIRKADIIFFLAAEV